MVLSNLFGPKGKYKKLTQKISLSLQLIKHLKPPFFSHIKWKSLSECVTFIFTNYYNLTSIIDHNYHYQAKIYSELKTTDWKSIQKATSIITSFICSMESDQMKIEFVFGEFNKTIKKLEREDTEIAKALLTEFVNVYSENDNLIVPLAAFLLTFDGSSFWQECSSEKQEFYKEYAWKGICKYCKYS